MYDNGWGVPLNYIKAYMWFSIAKTQGDELAAKYLGDIKRQMTTDQIAEAQRLATEWWEEHME